jgi:hypothetical protein
VIRQWAIGSAAEAGTVGVGEFRIQMNLIHSIEGKIHPEQSIMWCVSAIKLPKIQRRSAR